MDKIYYRAQEVDGKIIVTEIGYYNWMENDPFDGIELTDEPFDMSNFREFEKVNNKWELIENKNTVE